MEEFTTDRPNNKFVCREYTHPLTNLPPEIFIPEEDVFVLSQLLKIRQLEEPEIYNLISSINSSYPIFVLMNDEMKSKFSKLSFGVFPEDGDNAIFRRLEKFICDFLDHCIQKAEIVQREKINGRNKKKVSINTGYIRNQAY